MNSHKLSKEGFWHGGSFYHSVLTQNGCATGFYIRVAGNNEAYARAEKCLREDWVVIKH